jgi:hypothetical protein
MRAEGARNLTGKGAAEGILPPVKKSTVFAEHRRAEAERTPACLSALHLEFLWRSIHPVTGNCRHTHIDKGDK